MTFEAAWLALTTAEGIAAAYGLIVDARIAPESALDLEFRRGATVVAQLSLSTPPDPAPELLVNFVEGEVASLLSRMARARSEGAS